MLLIKPRNKRLRPLFSSEGFPQGASSTAGLTGHPVTWMFRLPEMRSGTPVVVGASIVPPLLRGSYSSVKVAIASSANSLQSCRPHSGAVIGYGREHQGLDCPTSIVPPLLRSGYPSVKVAIASSANSLQLCRPYSGAVINGFDSGGGDDCRASIVPPLCRGGYARKTSSSPGRTHRFNRAAPIPGRL